MALPKLKTTIENIFLGAKQDFWPGKAPSAIHKTVAYGAQTVEINGFIADEQADLAVHGGADKAIHHYAAEHYPFWCDNGHLPAATTPAAFGENISTLGLTEQDVCIGDIFEMGSAVLQISQGRQPCWKLNAYTDNKQMTSLFLKTGFTGWYYRVLTPGMAEKGDMMHLTDRPQDSWTVERVTRARLTKQVSKEDALYLAKMPELAEGWRTAFAKFAEGNKAEDTSARLNG